MWVTFCGISSFYIFSQDKDSGQICCLFLEKVFLALVLYISLIDTWIAPMKIFLFSFTLRFFWIALGKFSHWHVDHSYENFSFFFTFRFFWIGLGNGQLRGKLSNVWWTQPTLFFFHSFVKLWSSISVLVWSIILGKLSKFPSPQFNGDWFTHNKSRRNTNLVPTRHKRATFFFFSLQLSTNTPFRHGIGRQIQFCKVQNRKSVPNIIFLPIYQKAVKSASTLLTWPLSANHTPFLPMSIFVISHFKSTTRTLFARWDLNGRNPPRLVKSKRVEQNNEVGEWGWEKREEM